MNDLPNMDNHILPECFLDTNLVETLVPPINTYNHQTSNGAVTKAMRSAELNNKFAVGVLDRDKQQLPYLKEFDLLAAKHQQQNANQPQQVEPERLPNRTSTSPLGLHR